MVSIEKRSVLHSQDENEIKNPKEFLIRLREKVPFLQQIPDERYLSLDIKEFRIPTGDLVNARQDLENKLNQYVMTYNKDIFRLDIPVAEHLCANIVGAKLTEDELQILQDYEEKYMGERVSFVAYKKPLELTDPSKSDLSKLYETKGLIFSNKNIKTEIKS